MPGLITNWGAREWEMIGKRMKNRTKQRKKEERMACQKEGRKKEKKKRKTACFPESFFKKIYLILEKQIHR